MPNISSPLTPRPTIYKGIEMRSRLEALWAAEFDAEMTRQGNVLEAWAYEPYCFASPAGQYLPDFKLVLKGVTEYWDIKPFVVGEPLALMQRMEIVFASEPTARLRIVAGNPDKYDAWWGSVTMLSGERKILWYNPANTLEGDPDRFRVSRIEPFG